MNILAIEGKKYRCKNGETATVVCANFGMFGRSTMICNISDGQRLRYDLDGKVDAINIHEYDLVENIK